MGEFNTSAANTGAPVRFPVPLRFFHGGIDGLKVGDWILPPSETGKDTLLRYAVEVAPDGPQLRDRVYLTTTPASARFFACSYGLDPKGPAGDVYEVEPEIPIEPDPDCSEPGLSWQARRARIVRVVERCCRFSANERRVLLGL